jgi:hypothetical protein
MQVSVKSADIHCDGVSALVSAVSHDQMAGKPRAIVSMRLWLEVVAEESPKARFSRVRDEALRYLDVE